MPAGSWKKDGIFFYLKKKKLRCTKSQKAGFWWRLDEGVGWMHDDSPLERWDRCRPANSWRSVPSCEPCSTWVRTAVVDLIREIGLCGDCGGRAVRSVNDDFYPWGLLRSTRGYYAVLVRRPPMCIAVGSHCRRAKTVHATCRRVGWRWSSS